ncbi:MAG: hypothetical protein WC783_02480 [Candidatus Paceibacterota bacterium]|jgi:hypothetical protein
MEGTTRTQPGQESQRGTLFIALAIVAVIVIIGGGLWLTSSKSDSAKKPVPVATQTTKQIAAVPAVIPAPTKATATPVKKPGKSPK